MSNQAPNSHTPQNQTPSLTDEGTTLGMKPPIFPPELLKRFEQTKAMTFSEKTVKEVNELLIQSELKKQQLQEYIEINWIKLETENLWRPTCPNIKILKEWDKIISWKSYCWNNWDDWYYNWYAAMLEAKYLWKRIPTDEEFTQIFGLNNYIALSSKKCGELIRKLNIKIVGSWLKGTYKDRGSYFYLWSSTEHDMLTSSGRYLDRYGSSIYCFCRDKSTYGFSVRCIMKPEEKIQERESPPF